MVGVGCPVALHSTDPLSPGMMVNLLGSKTTVGRSENNQEDKNNEPVLFRNIATLLRTDLPQVIINLSA